MLFLWSSKIEHRETRMYSKSKSWFLLPKGFQTPASDSSAARVPKKNGRTKSRSSGHFPEVPCSLVSLSLWTYKFIAIVNTLPSALRALALSLSLSRIIYFSSFFSLSLLSFSLFLFFLFITSNKNLVALCSTSRKAYVPREIFARVPVYI